MKTTTYRLSTLTAAALCLAACGDTRVDTDTDATIGIETITPTVSATASDSDSDSGTDTDGGSDSDSDSDSGETTGGKIECEVDADCMDPAKLCSEDRECVFNPDFCGEADIDIEVETPSVVLVLDKSGSMVANSWDSDADPNTPDVTRWFSLYSVVELIAESFDMSMNLGMVLYPSTKAKSEYNINACLVEASPDVPVAPQSGGSILATMPPAAASGSEIAGGTPARAGVITAFDHLLSLADDMPKYVVLVTDGAANCSLEAADESERFEVYDEALLQQVADAYAQGITTFVVGIDIENAQSETKQDGNPDATNTFDKLNALAEAGGMPKDGDTAFYNSLNQIELQEALTSISKQVLPCEIPLDPVPDFPDWVEVKVGDGKYQKTAISDCATEDGWMYVDDAKDSILLCGALCSEFQMTGDLDAQYRCPDAG
ncbi:MAG: VWA domain-containing protein [Myxococcales bacterium]|nr:VWA domain-containing protein [Myxococcales bacterium]